MPATNTVAGGSTKDLLLRAGERLFAEHGIHRVRLREINELAGQRNPSALHYHFGSRDGLVQAILASHQREMDQELRPRIADLAARGGLPSVREIVATAVQPIAEQLETQSGRDFLRILPQILDLVSWSVRTGSPLQGASQPARILALLERHLAGLPVAVRRERLVAYVLLLTSLFAERAVLLESGTRPALDAEQFIAHAVDVISGMLDASSTVRPRRRAAARR